MKIFTKIQSTIISIKNHLYLLFGIESKMAGQSDFMKSVYRAAHAANRDQLEIVKKAEMLKAA